MANQWQRLFITIFSTVLIVDGLILIGQGNIDLGTIFPTILGSASLVYIMFQDRIHSWINQSAYRRKGIQIVSVLSLMLITSIIAFCIWMSCITNSHQTLQRKETELSAIIVLGCKIQNQRPSAMLQTRIDKAIELAKKNPNTMIIATGGKDLRSRSTEAEIIKSELAHYNISKNRILLKNQSTSTFENLYNAKTILQQRNINIETHNIAIVSNDFHMQRVNKIAQKLGYKFPIMIEVTTPAQIRINSWIREYFAFIKGKISREY